MNTKSALPLTVVFSCDDAERQGAEHHKLWPECKQRPGRRWDVDLKRHNEHGKRHEQQREYAPEQKFLRFDFTLAANIDELLIELRSASAGAPVGVVFSVLFTSEPVRFLCNFETTLTNVSFTSVPEPSAVALLPRAWPLLLSPTADEARAVVSIQFESFFFFLGAGAASGRGSGCATGLAACG